MSLDIWKSFKKEDKPRPFTDKEYKRIFGISKEEFDKEARDYYDSKKSGEFTGD